MLRNLTIGKRVLLIFVTFPVTLAIALVLLAALGWRVALVAIALGLIAVVAQVVLTIRYGRRRTREWAAAQEANANVRRSYTAPGTPAGTVDDVVASEGTVPQRPWYQQL